MGFNIATPLPVAYPITLWLLSVKHWALFFFYSRTPNTKIKSMNKVNRVQFHDLYLVLKSQLVHLAHTKRTRQYISLSRVPWWIDVLFSHKDIFTLIRDILISTWTFGNPHCLMCDFHTFGTMRYDNKVYTCES